MKNIAAQMINFDREQMRRIANNMPEQYDEKPQVQQVAQIINVYSASYWQLSRRAWLIVTRTN